MASGHGGWRPGAGRKRKQQTVEHQQPSRSGVKASALEHQRARAIARGRLETAARIEAKRLEFMEEE